jgi:hypothetical protein
VRPTGRGDLLALLATAGSLAGIIVVTHGGRWLAAAAALARSPLVPVLTGCLLAGLLALLLTRHLLTARTLRDRLGFLIVPADSFDPDPEAVLRFAAGLVRVRRLLAGFFDARASAVRIRLDTDPDGRLRYTIEIPAHARTALRTALAGYDGVQLHEVTDEPAPVAAGRVARMELAPARRVEPLRRTGLDPDPLAGFARALGQLHADHDERGTVCVDLLPITPARRRVLRRRMLRAAGREHEHRTQLSDLLAVDGKRGGRDPAEHVARRVELHALTNKLGSPDPLFAIQVLLHATAPTIGTAKTGVRGLLAAFDVFTGENHFSACGLRLPGGSAFLGAEVPWRWRRFDWRARSGLFAPARQRLVTATEVAGLLKPPTAKCPAANVLRCGGVIPPPPPGLATFRGQRELLPLGTVKTEDGERMVGVPLEGTFFSYMAGRSRYGKTETGIGQFLHLARAGHGCFFLDPHEDAIERIKRHLTDDGLRERVIEVNLATDTDRQPGWNLLARGRRPVHQQVDAVVDAFASTLGWDEINTRALNLTTQATQALIELGHHLPPELAPTLFQIPTLLADEDWRAAALPHVSPATRRFFTDRFPRLSPEAITPVTNLIDRLRAAPAVAGLLGNPRCSYDIRAAMDKGMVVLACPGDGSGRDRLVANFLVYDLLHAAKTRAAIPPERRRPFYVFLDEVQTYDGATGGNLAALLEQSAKYGIRAFLFNQNPERLTAATWNAVTTNRSHLMTTALNARGAALLAREFAGAIEPETIPQLERYTFLASATLRGQASQPFLVHGVSADDLHPPAEDPEQLTALAEAIDRSTARQPITETLAALDQHDDRIAEHLQAARTSTGSTPDPGADAEWG